METYTNQFYCTTVKILSLGRDLAILLVRRVSILWIGRSVWHDHDGIRERVVVVRHDVLFEPLAKNPELLPVLLVFRGSDIFPDAPTNDDQLIP